MKRGDLYSNSPTRFAIDAEGEILHKLKSTTYDPTAAERREVTEIIRLAIEAAIYQHGLSYVWRPFTTAPKDGRRFMFKLSNGFVGVGWFIHGRAFACDKFRPDRRRSLRHNPD